MTRTRDFRRKKHFAKVKRAYKILKGWYFPYAQEYIDWNAHRMAENLKICSCPGCGNPRRKGIYLNKEERMTLQERKNLISYKEQRVVL